MRGLHKTTLNEDGTTSQRCLMCGVLCDETNPLGYCDDCEPDVVENLVNALTKPLYVWRMAHAVIPTNTGYARFSQSHGMVKSAKTRKRNAEKEIIRIVSSI